MNNKKLFFTISLLFNLLIINNVFSQKFIVSDFKELTTDISAREHKVLDVNDEPCALIKIYTSFKNLTIEGNRGVEKTEQHKGVLWIWVAQGTRQLKISNDNMPMLPYYFKSGLKASTVYSIELSSDQLFSIVINTHSIPASVTINSKTYKTNETIAGLPKGEYVIHISTLGYNSLTDTIQVSKEKLFFSYKLKKVKQNVLTITTIPYRCLLFIDGEQIGYTNFSGYYYPDKYHIQISKADYSTIDTTIIFDPLIQGTFNFKLTKNIGWVSASSLPPGIIAIDGKYKTTNYVKLNADKLHELIIKKPYYKTYKETFKLTRGDTLDKTITLEKKKGQLSFIIKPDTTQITLTDRFKLETKWTGNKVIDLPIGAFQLEATAKGYYKLDTAFVIKEDKHEYLTYSLNPKKFSTVGAGFFSMLFPGAGQYYTQRNTTGTLYLITTLSLAGATGYMYMQTENQTDTYLKAQEEYKNETNTDLIPQKRKTMDDAYKKYTNLEKQRNMLLYTTAGIYLFNIIDAVVFAKHYAPILPKNISDNFHFNIGATPKLNSANFLVSYKF